jgi:hypothetical protein
VFSGEGYWGMGSLGLSDQAFGCSRACFCAGVSTLPLSAGFDIRTTDDHED